MSKVLIAIFVICGAVVAVGAQTPEKDAVRVPLGNYIKAHATGDPEYAVARIVLDIQT